MPNATQKVPADVVGWEDQQKQKYQIASADRTTTYQNREMVGIVLAGSDSGKLDHFDDTQALLFAGLYESIQQQFVSTDVKPLDIKDIIRPALFSMPLSSGTSARSTDIGKAVYAVDNSHVQIGSAGLSFANIVGYIQDVVTTDQSVDTGSQVRIRPVDWDQVRVQLQGLSGVAMTITGGKGGNGTTGTAGNGVGMTETGGAGGSATSGTAGSGGSWAITGGVGGAVTTGTPGGTGGNITLTGGAGGAATAGTGNGGVGGNIVLVGGAGGTSAGGTAGAAGTVQATGLVMKSASAAAITAARTLTAADSGGTFSVAKTSAYAIALPVPVQGLRFKFMVLDAGANAVTISDGAAHQFGDVSVNNVNTSVNAITTTTLAATGDIGDWLEYVGIDATHYMVTGACKTAAKITFA